MHFRVGLFRGSGASLFKGVRSRHRCGFSGVKIKHIVDFLHKILSPKAGRILMNPPTLKKQCTISPGPGCHDRAKSIFASFSNGYSCEDRELESSSFFSSVDFSHQGSFSEVKTNSHF